MGKEFRCIFLKDDLYFEILETVSLEEKTYKSIIVMVKMSKLYLKLSATDKDLKQEIRFINIQPKCPKQRSKQDHKPEQMFKRFFIL